MDQDIYIDSFSALTRILMSSNLKAEKNNQTNDKNNEEVASNAGSRKSSSVNDKALSSTNEKKDNSYFSINILISRFVIPHLIRVQISENENQKLESLKKSVDLWKHFIHIEKVIINLNK